jgi:hypothetical protein
MSCALLNFNLSLSIVLLIRVIKTLSSIEFSSDSTLPNFVVAANRGQVAVHIIDFEHRKLSLYIQPID